ncbi:MAG: RNA methyltransferase [Alphaproteobacteria bacterium]|nr:RNA methyltransferase [Alphaproteobacteria bacterium]
MVSVILVNPQMGENIGAAARAMFNFGLTDLRIVNPRDGWPNEKADTMSAGALGAMPPVLVFPTLQDAISDLHFALATTARSRDMVKPVYCPPKAVEETRRRVEAGQKAGFVFGAERMGLVNDDVALCQGIVNIPVNPAFSSLNIATAVLAICYEWNRARHEAGTPLEESGKLYRKDSPPAPQGEIEGFLDRLLNALEDRHFYRTDEVAPYMKRNIRNIFSRADITTQELRTLHGVLSSLLDGKPKPPEK